MAPSAPAAGAPGRPHESAGCARPSSRYPAGTTTGSVAHAGDDRSFRVHVPPGYDGTVPAPLVLMFHGGGGSGEQLQERSSRMDRVADREGFITVYPDGTGVLKTWNGGGCCGAAVRKDVDDVGFVSALLDHLEAELCLDRRRVFASGMSNGGLFSHRLACELSERIAGIAAVAGTDMTRTCAPTRPVAVLQIHGTADGHVPWQGGEGCGLARVAFTSVPATLEAWRERNRCSSTQSSGHRAGNGACESYDGCAPGGRVTLCTIDGGGHSWPGGVARDGVIDCPGNGPQSQSFAADEVIWRFFADVPPR